MLFTQAIQVENLAFFLLMKHQGVHRKVQQGHHLKKEGDGGFPTRSFDVGQMDRGNVQHFCERLLGISFLHPGSADGVAEAINGWGHGVISLCLNLKD